MLYPLVVGLGNPGSGYVETRHNAGYMVVEGWARKKGLGWKRLRFGDAEGTQTPEGVWLMKPLGFMNLSGEAVRAALDWFKLEPEKILVVMDDVSLKLGQLRLREKGSAGGHNGLRSIEQHLGTQSYARLKCGVGAAPERMDLVDHVLGKFGPDEKEVVQRMITRAVDALELCEHEGVVAAMNEVNREV
ncbi:MAG: aminoacyl-tRNA hydrolase [Blastochloris sp.]|nr:aminoacyl-tRNA hydrolase [Blastochloris sp.]